MSVVVIKMKLELAKTRKMTIEDLLKLMRKKMTLIDKITWRSAFEKDDVLVQSV